MSLQARTVGIIGVGHVGAHVGNSLLLQGIADELYLCDIDRHATEAQTQDLSDSLLFCPHNALIRDCGDRYEELASCDIIVNAAGKVALAKENRDGELFFSSDAVHGFAQRIVDAGFKGIWVTIANPCDVVATAFWKLTDYDPARIIGTGTALDSARLRYQIARVARIDPKSIDAYMVGEHGFSGFAAWSGASIGGIPLQALAELDPQRFDLDRDDLGKKALYGGYVTLNGKGCTEYAVANAAARIIAAVFHDEHSVMGASTLLTGQYGQRGIFTSLPCIIGREGIEEVLDPGLDDAEIELFRASCEHIRTNISQISWWPK
ncbi:malate dehydrogenase (NAD) [Coriobacterium glomerans PW2]|uniref:Malate dehydrogenase (NAD) n=1 Tax=Coriobacterium glomerans (strain ATCC 49209 / DSM 20642 / JCM 10262 / PW2) TaxID=700015 RepID=F2N907_CORGP|nr:lactate dehydrogenase [Coriobacterium glomerans]AEB07607.1 malate dehydrogenase (NAD) [Coriobacterium glomerans PW2]